jgi:acetyl esterase
MSPRTDRSFISDALPAWQDQIVPSDAGALAVRVYGCPKACGRAPLVLHFHAGAFAGGSLAGGVAVARAFAEAGTTVASVDYPLAPAHPFPRAVEAGYAALQWLERESRRLAGARVPLFVAGEEAGGNIAAAVAMVARDRAGPELAGQVLMSPMLDVCVGTASQRDARAGPVGCPWADGWRAYLPRAADATHPYATPGAAQRLAGLPATLLVTAQDDPLRDETQAFARRLLAAGVPVQLSVLGSATGWPRSYLRGDDAPWRASLRERVQPFVRSTITTAGSHA